jgi:hypothetical protein
MRKFDRAALTKHDGSVLQSTARTLSQRPPAMGSKRSNTHPYRNLTLLSTLCRRLKGNGVLIKIKMSTYASSGVPTSAEFLIVRGPPYLRACFVSEGHGFDAHVWGVAVLLGNVTLRMNRQHIATRTRKRSCWRAYKVKHVGPRRC